MTEYVLGFMFSNDRKHCLLIKKMNPEWQKGLMNGIGGHIEEGEAPADAMMREFHEETGITMNNNKWEKFLVMKNKEWKVYVYRAFSDHIYEAFTTTEESVCLMDVAEIPLTKEFEKVYINNLSWLIPLALDNYYQLKNNYSFSGTIRAGQK